MRRPVGSAHGPDLRRWLVLGGFLGATLLVGGISSAFTSAAIPEWYEGLTKPSFNPPKSVFAPVWTLLYIMMGVAVWLVWKSPPSALRSRGLLFFWVQLALNFAWTAIFFGQRMIGPALAEIVILWLAILLTCWTFFGVNKIAGWLFVPYLGWVSFAAVLNLEIWRLNR